MLSSITEREKFIDDMMNFIKSKYDLTDTQIFVFGSFLTDEFIPGESDIDIGIYSENEIKMYDIKTDLEIYFDKFNLDSDIVIMNLNKKLWINIPIMVYGKQLTKYENKKLNDYLIEMIKEFGFNPNQKKKVV